MPLLPLAVADPELSTAGHQLSGLRASAAAVLGRRKSFTEDEVEAFWAARRAAAAASDDAAASSVAGGGDRHLATVPETVRQDGAAEAAAGPFTGSEPDDLSAAAKKAIASPYYFSDYRSSPTDAAGSPRPARRWTRSNWAFLNDRPDATSASANANSGARGSLQHDLAARNTHASDHFSYHAAGSSTAAVSH
eukprot:SM000466S16658  [mRNA]  locus=s466:15675:16394:- [translate_table: standard]